MPQILIDGRPIGGYTELWQLDRDGELDEPLAACPPRPLEPLAPRTLPGAAPGDTDLVDRRPAALARLAPAAVDAELVLHAALAPSGLAVVAQRRALTRDPRVERLAHAPVKRLSSRRLERAGDPQRVEPRAPERLVGVDVPDAGDRALVEQRRLQRRPPAAQRLAQPAGVNASSSGSWPSREAR